MSDPHRTDDGVTSNGDEGGTVSTGSKFRSAVMRAVSSTGKAFWEGVQASAPEVSALSGAWNATTGVSEANSSKRG